MIVFPLLFFLLNFSLLYYTTDAAIIHRSGSLHFTSDLHVSGDVHSKNYSCVNCGGINSIDSTKRDCQGEYKLKVIGSMPGIHVDLLFSNTIWVGEEIYYLRHEVLKFNVETLGFESLRAGTPYTDDREDTRIATTIFSPILPSEPSLYIFGGRNPTQTHYYKSTWKLRLDDITWQRRDNHSFVSRQSRSVCSLDACYVQGGLLPEDEPMPVANLFFKYDYWYDKWANMTSSDSPRISLNSLHYLPRIDSLVILGGRTHTGASYLTVKDVHLFNLSSSNWTSFMSPEERGDIVGSGGYNFFHNALSVVYREDIYIIAGRIPLPSRLIRMTFSHEGEPFYEHLNYSNSEYFGSDGMLDSVGVLAHDNFLIMGGYHRDDDGINTLSDIVSLSLC